MCTAQVKFYTLISEGPYVPGQVFQVQYVAEGAKDIRQFTIPEFKNFLVLQSFDSKSTSLQSPGLTLTESYSKIIVITPRKAGRFTIPAATAVLDGSKRKTNPIKIEVVTKANASLHFEEAPEEVDVEKNSLLRPGENISEKIKNNIFLKAIVSKSSCFTGEGILLTYKMYSRMNTSSQVLKRPSLTGLSILEMVDTYDGKPEIEKINGVPYYVNLIRKVQGFPLQSGKIEFDKAEVSSVVHFVKMESSSGSNAAGYPSITSSYDYPVTLVTPHQELDVKPLPTVNQPSGFLGAVGKFSMHMEVSKKEIHPGDLVKIRLIIKGTGNIPLLVPPVVRWPIGVDTAEPEVKEDFNRYVFPLQGSKSFEYSFTAPSAGSYTIPSTEFFYFNPVTSTYETSMGDSLTIRVSEHRNVASPPSQQIVMPMQEPAIPRQIYWFGIVVLCIVGWISYQFWRSKERKPKVVPIKTAIEERQEILPDALFKRARAALENGNTVSFYQELEQSTWKMIAKGSGILPSALNKQNVRFVLAAKGIQTDRINELMELLDTCERFRYSPSPVEGGEVVLLQKAEKLVMIITEKK